MTLCGTRKGSFHGSDRALWAAAVICDPGQCAGNDVLLDFIFFMRHCDRQKLIVLFVASFFVSLTGREGSRTAKRLLIHKKNDSRKMIMYKTIGKRLIDIILSLCGLIVLSPAFLMIAIAVIINDPGPVFFSQKRIAKNKQGKMRYFQLYKFRSMKMTTPHDIPTHLLENPEQYITRVGRFLRRFSLDEFPQLWNILKGDMSIIGPRPALWNQDDLYAEREKYGANDVTPGLSGWAQVNGRDELEIDVKAKFDGDYARNVTFKMDATCFIMTIANVLRHSGIVEGGTGAFRKHIEKRNQEIDRNA